MQPDTSLPKSPKVKQYLARLNNVGTSAPIEIEHINTIGNITWTRAEAGRYLGTLTDAWTANKITLSIQDDSATGRATIQRTSTSIITYRTMDVAGTLEDGHTVYINIQIIPNAIINY